MCVMSMVSDYQIDKWKSPAPITPVVVLNVDSKKLEVKVEELTKQIDALQKDFLDFKNLMLRAIEYDKKNNEPECEVDDKVRIIKEVAKHLGIDVSDIWPETINKE